MRNPVSSLPPAPLANSQVDLTTVQLLTLTAMVGASSPRHCRCLSSRATSLSFLYFCRCLPHSPSAGAPGNIEHNRATPPSFFPVVPTPCLPPFGSRGPHPDGAEKHMSALFCFMELHLCLSRCRPTKDLPGGCHEHLTLQMSEGDY